MSLSMTMTLRSDVLEELRNLGDESANCIVTSPPYYMMCRYGPDRREIGWEPSVGKYVTRLVGVFHEAQRVLRSDGICWINVGDSYGEGKSVDGQRAKRGFPAGCRVLVPERLAIALQADGWIVRQHVVWDRCCYRQRRGARRPRDSHESVLMLTKTRKYFWNDTQEARLSVWRIAPARLPRAEQTHPCPFPIELARRCIEAGCPRDGVVLDPFVGSGTTLRAAKELGRSSIGIDLLPQRQRNPSN